MYGYSCVDDTMVLKYTLLMPSRISVQADEILTHVGLVFRKFASAIVFILDYAVMFFRELHLDIKWRLLKDTLRVSNADHMNQVIVSLTSHTPRFRYLRKTLICLLLQDHGNFKIVVNLSQLDYSNLSFGLKGFEKFGVEFRVNQTDLKVFMKLLPSLQSFPNSTIVTADDDIYYGKTWLSTLTSESFKYPNSIVGFRSVIVPKELSGTSYAEWPSPSESMESKDGLLLTGVAGVLYPPLIFRREIHKLFELMELSPRNDDLVYYVAANFLGLTRVHLHCQFTFPKYWNGSQRIALWRMNVNEELNDSQFKALQEYKNFFNENN